MGVDWSKASEFSKAGEFKASIEVKGGLTTIGYGGSKPIFTLTDILEILPKEIKIEDNIACIIITSYDNQWIVDYEDNLTSHIDYAAPELIDALYQLLCWTIKNHFFKNK